ncbi:hypothetical protein VKS41_003720 [Umbelopsis sp. WA50703]
MRAFFPLASSLVILQSLVPGSLGFCVYNNLKGDNTLFVQQISGWGRDATSAFTCDYLTSGNRACCNYHNTGCVAGGNINQNIELVVELSGNAGFTTLQYWIVDIPGGGWLNVTGTPGSILLNAYDSQGDHLKTYQ